MDPTDLEHNRRGLLGPGQRARLEALSASHRSIGTFGREVDAYHAYHARLRTALQDGRVMASAGRVGVDLRELHSGTAAGIKSGLAGNDLSAYCAALDGGGNVKLAEWLVILPGRYELYTVAWVGLVAGAPPCPALATLAPAGISLCLGGIRSAQGMVQSGCISFQPVAVSLVSMAGWPLQIQSPPPGVP